VTTSLARIKRFEQSIKLQIAARTERFRWGTAFFDPDHPLVWDLNFLEVETTEPPFTADDLVAAADRLQGGAGIPHRRIVLDHRPSAERLAPRFLELQWMVNRFLYMELHGDRDRLPAASRTRELDREAHLATYLRTASEAPYGSEPEVIRQLADQTDLVAAHTHVRYFGAADDDGTLAAICVLFSDGEIAQIEDVATLKAYRRRGLATDLLAFVISEAVDAGHDLVFLVADTDDWPKELYAKLGFDPLAISHDFVLPGDVTYAQGDA